MKQSAKCFFHALEVALQNVAVKKILVGRRCDARSLIQQEVDNGWAKIGVIVCGPGSLCDYVRAAVIELGRKDQPLLIWKSMPMHGDQRLQFG